MSFDDAIVKYSEIFYTIQGEGKLIGVPSVFFRTSYCNLRCVWCDTPYTSWRPENKQITVAEAVEAITQYNCKHVVITGGEPFVQGRELTELCHELDRRGHHITIETNATIFAPAAAHLISMSPKLRNSNPPSDNRFFRMHERGRIRADVIRRFLERYECQVKFVVDSPDDIKEISALGAEIPIPAEVIILMPQGMTPEELRPKQEWLIELCKAHGYRYSPRVHVDIWGNRRGV
jgi:7-carboxy-7-deazaguanine synthase